jgi:hypothetical protein
MRPAADVGPGYNARERLAQLEALSELQARLLRHAGDRLDALERRNHAISPPMRPEPRLLPIREAARRCGLSVRSMKRLIERGAIEGCAVSVTGSQRRRWLVAESALASFLSTPAPRDPAR